MVGVLEDFGQLYRNALAERDPNRKAFLLRGVQEALDNWAQTCETPPHPRPRSLGPQHIPVEARITQIGGVYERSLPSVA